MVIYNRFVLALVDLTTIYVHLGVIYNRFAIIYDHLTVIYNRFAIIYNRLTTIYNRFTVIYNRFAVIVRVCLANCVNRARRNTGLTDEAIKS